MTFKTVAVATFAILIVGSVVWILATARFALALTVLAFLIAVAMDHVVKAFERWGLRRWMAISLVVLCVLGTISTLAFLVVPAAATQASELIKSVPQLIDELRASRTFHRLDRILHIKAELDNPSRRIVELAKNEMAPLLSMVGGVLTAASGFVVVTFLTIFMLASGGPLVKAALAEARPERRPVYGELVRKIHNTIGGYVSGLVIICSVNATMTTAFLAINRTPFFLPLGLLSGLSSLVPYAGPLVAGVTVSAIAFGAGGAEHGIVAAVYFIAYGQLEGNVLGPLIFRRAVNANPLLVTLSILFLGEVGGVLGAVAAVPLLVVVQIVVSELLRLRRAGLRQRVIARTDPSSESHPTPT